MILDPDRIVFQTLVGIEVEMVVVVVGVIVMLMHEIAAQEMVRQRVLAALILVFRIGHRARCCGLTEYQP